MACGHPSRGRLPVDQLAIDILDVRDRRPVWHGTDASSIRRHREDPNVMVSRVVEAILVELPSGSEAPAGSGSRARGPRRRAGGDAEVGDGIGFLWSVSVAWCLRCAPPGGKCLGAAGDLEIEGGAPTAFHGREE